ncbi:hypothetical protein QLX08_003746 [Tetragonisca angustula]|uniref:Major facilitator superfamily (MFS) profile domain-containing protein n=1 Tax=Tetragonisca angustula TaxID=166442 RepID=A0AAW1A7E8_9HYME
MSSIDFDEVLVHVGEKGKYQNIMYYLLCISATLPAAFLAFSQVFVSASPEHWCRIPELDNLTDLMTLEERKALSLPYVEKSDGKVKKYSKCKMYDVNYTAIVESWLENAVLENATEEDGEAQRTRSRSGLPPPPVGNPDWPVTKCRHGWIYDNRDYDSTLVTELDLVCDNSWWPSTSTTFFYVGSLFGNVVFGWIADKWGRRTAFFAILFLEVIFSIATSFSPNYVIYTALRTVNGLSFPAIYQIPFILALELMGPRYRTFAGMVICMFFASAMSLLAVLGYLLRHWFTLSLATSVPFVLLFSYYWIIPESPRWLLSKNRIDEAEVIVQRMAKINGRTVPNNFLRKMEVEILRRQGVSCNGTNSSENPESNETEDRSPPPAATPMDLIRNPNIRKKFFILAFDWVANAVVYNGLSYNATNLGVSDYLAFFIGGLVEIPSYVITWYAMDRLGRRWVLCLTMLLGGVACVSCMFVPEDAVWVTVSLAMIGKFGIAASFAVFYVFVGELLPTVLRSQAMGIASFIAGIGLLAFPYIVHLAVYSRVLPLIIMGTLSVAGALTSIFLPETLNIHLPQTIEEGELFGADFKLWSCPTLPRSVSSSPSSSSPPSSSPSLSSRSLFPRENDDDAFIKKESVDKSESVPLRFLVNGRPGNRSLQEESAATGAATTPEAKPDTENSLSMEHASTTGQETEEELARPIDKRVDDPLVAVVIVEQRRTQ